MEALYRVVSEHGSRQKGALQRIEKAHPLRYLPQNVQSAFKRAGASGDHRAYRRGGQAASGRLSSHGEGRKLRERLVFHPGLGAAYGGFSAETLQRTKGTMGDGVLMYGSAASDAEQGSGERIIWQFDPSTFDVRGSAGEEDTDEA